MKGIYLKASFFILFTLMATVGFNQLASFSLTGKVSDYATSKGLKNSTVTLKNEKTLAIKTVLTNEKGIYSFKNLSAGHYELSIEAKNYENYTKSHIALNPTKKTTLNVKLKLKKREPIPIEIEEIVSKDELHTEEVAPIADFKHNAISNRSFKRTAFTTGHLYDPIEHNTESYAGIEENGYKLTTVNPLSTFSVDVDAASYSNVRRFLLNGQKPEKGAVRVEEMINYFHYDYPNPTGNDPFSITTEVGECPWSKNKLVHIGLQGKRIEKKNLPASNLVFLLDVSGSMSSPNKLPLLKKSFKLLVNELGEKDKIAIVVYAGAAGVVLNSTSATNSSEILEALENLQAGGSTAGGEGIKLAYKVAKENFIEGGNNRVILATDGDFNIGMSSDAAMKDLIEEERKSGVFLTCLGFGTGNLKDSKMEMLADKGNGNYAYIDNLLEAKKVLVTEIGATLIALAKDVKIQVEFNPSVIESYRLIGYENRLLNAEDFNDDTKDAGEIGAGHSVTALYEVVLKGEGDGSEPTVDPLKYQNNGNEQQTLFNDELLTVKFRYKEPDGESSKLIERNLKNKFPVKNSTNFNFSAAVAGFGMLLRASEFKGDLLFTHVKDLAEHNLGADKNGYRAEFIRLVEAAQMIYQ